MRLIPCCGGGVERARHAWGAVVVLSRSWLESYKYNALDEMVCGVPQFEIQGSRFRVQGSGFRVQGSGFRGQGSGFRVQGTRFLFSFQLVARALERLERILRHLFGFLLLLCLCLFLDVLLLLGSSAAEHQLARLAPGQRAPPTPVTLLLLLPALLGLGPLGWKDWDWGLVVGGWSLVCRV